MHVPKQIDIGGFNPRMRDLTRALAAPMLGDPELVARLMACLKPQDEDARLELQGQPEWVVATALFVFCHRSSDRVFIGNLTEEVNHIQAEIGESRMLTPEAVGRIVRRSLNADTKRVGRGYYLLLSADRRRRIHELARNMGLTKADILEPDTVRSGYGGPPCELCAEFGLNTLPDGTELRCVNLPRRQVSSLFEPIKNTDTGCSHHKAYRPQGSIPKFVLPGVETGRQGTGIGERCECSERSRGSQGKKH